MDIEQTIFPSYRAATDALTMASEEIKACEDKLALWNWHQKKGNEIFGKLRDFDTQTGNWKYGQSYCDALHIVWREKLLELDMNNLLSSFGNYYEQYKANQERL